VLDLQRGGKGGDGGARSLLNRGTMGKQERGEQSGSIVPRGGAGREGPA
jgi:hypothetical protein